LRADISVYDLQSRPLSQRKTLDEVAFKTNTNRKKNIYTCNKSNSCWKTLEERVTGGTRSGTVAIVFICVREQHCPTKGDKQTPAQAVHSPKDTVPQYLNRVGC